MSAANPHDGFAHDLILLAHERALIEAQIRRVVEHARTHGSTWADVGQALGVTKQAAQQRYGRPTKSLP